MIRILLSNRLGEKKWTQAKLSRMTGIRAATISDLYNEIAEKINFKDLYKICKALDCNISDLIAIEDNPYIEESTEDEST